MRQRPHRHPRVLRRLRPYLTRDKPGRVLDRARAERAIESELEDNARDTITLMA